MHGELNFVLERFETSQNAYGVSDAYILLRDPLSEITLPIATPLIVLVHPKHATNYTRSVIH